MVEDFFGLVAQFAQSADESEDPAARLANLMDDEGKEAFARELRAMYNRDNS
mgnify:CR=1 FL=1